MKVNGFFNRLSKQRGAWHRWGGWLVLLTFLAILYLLGSYHWHVLRLFIFIPLFILLCLGVILSMMSLQPGKDD